MSNFWLTILTLSLTANIISVIAYIIESRTDNNASKCMNELRAECLRLLDQNHKLFNDNEELKRELERQKNAPTLRQ